MPALIWINAADPNEGSVRNDALRLYRGSLAGSRVADEQRAVLFARLLPQRTAHARKRQRPAGRWSGLRRAANDKTRSTSRAPGRYRKVTQGYSRKAQSGLGNCKCAFDRASHETRIFTPHHVTMANIVNEAKTRTLSMEANFIVSSASYPFRQAT